MSIRARDPLARLARLRAIELGIAARASLARAEALQRAAESLARLDRLIGTAVDGVGTSSARDLAGAARQRARLCAARETADARLAYTQRQADAADRTTRVARGRADAVDRLSAQRDTARARTAESRERENVAARVRKVFDGDRWADTP